MRIFLRSKVSYLTLVALTICVVADCAKAQDSAPGTVVSAQTVEISSLAPGPSPPSIRAPGSREKPFAAPTPIVESSAASKELATHRFWDRENRVLFAVTGLAATSDFFVTHANLSSGGGELDPVARLFTESTPALASNFALQTAGVIGVSYLFQRPGTIGWNA
jgi:hypothetical protein